MIDNDRRAVLGQLVAQAHRVTRLAGSATGSTTPSSHSTVLALLARDGDHRIGEIARATRLTQPAVTQVVGALEAEGLVARIPDSTDGRAHVVSVTDAGRTHLDRWRRTLADTLAPMLGEIDDDDWAALARTAEVLGRIGGAR